LTTLVLQLHDHGVLARFSIIALIDSHWFNFKYFPLLG